MRGVRAVFLIITVLASVGGNSSEGSTPPLPFSYLNACKARLTTTPNATTVLLFYDPWALSSPSPSSCSCNVTSPSQINLARLGPTQGVTNITVTHNDTTTTLNNRCQTSVDTEVADCSRWVVSEDRPLTISLMSVGEEGEEDGEQTSMATARRRRKRKTGGGGYVLLAVQGQHAVKIKCRELNAESTDQPPSLPTAPTGLRNATNGSLTLTPPPDHANHTTTTTSSIPSLPSSSSSNSSTAGSKRGDNSSSSATTTTTTTTSDGGGGSGGDDNKKQTTTSDGGGVGVDPEEIGKGPSDHLESRDKDQGDNSQASLPEFLVLGLGVTLSVAAVFVIVVVVVKHRRSRKNSTDLENPPPSQQDRGRRNTTAATSSNNNKNSHSNNSGGGGGKGKGKPSKAAAGSRDSLLNENHNYEEVSDDGLGQVGLHVERDRKISNMSLPSATYSHIKAAAAATSSSSSSQARRNTTPAVTASDNEDYNHLDLAQSARRFNPGAAAASSSAAGTFYVSEDDDYMDVNDPGPVDDAGSDIYEAVDGDPDRTPLCARREGEGSRGEKATRPEYTECISSEDGKFHIVGTRDSKTSGKPPVSCLSNLPPTKGEGKNRPPHIPTSPPPQTGRGLQRSNSRSMDQLARERFQNKSHQQQQRQHRHSKSLDLNLCQQRDLFLHAFRSQGDGAERADAQPPPGEDFYINMPASAAHSSDLTPASSQQQHAPTTPTSTTQPHPDPATSSPQATKAATTSSPRPQATTSQQDPQLLPSPGAEPVMMRRKSRGSSKKKGGGGGGGGVEGRRTMVDHLKELNTGLLELETAVRHSMEIKDDELVMMDNIIYGTLPRNLSLPTTEL